MYIHDTWVGTKKQLVMEQAWDYADSEIRGQGIADNGPNDPKFNNRAELIAWLLTNMTNREICSGGGYRNGRWVYNTHSAVRWAVKAAGDGWFDELISNTKPA